MPGSQCPDWGLFGFPLLGASGTQIGAVPAAPGVEGVPGRQCPDWGLFGFPGAMEKMIYILIGRKFNTLFLVARK